MRGTWRVQAYADPKGEPLAQAAFLVEDFEPERIAFALTTEAKGIDPADPPAIPIEARFLYGAPAAGLIVEGETVVRPARVSPTIPATASGSPTTIPSPRPSRSPSLGPMPRAGRRSGWSSLSWSPPAGRWRPRSRCGSPSPGAGRWSGT
jgi:hypothetical protein